MKPEIQHIKFNNKQVPKSHFDLIKLEELFTRKMNHRIDEIHKVNFYAILLITEGRGKHTIDFVDYEYEKGSIITVRKDQIHKYFISNAKGYLLFFTNDFLISYLENLEANKSLRVFCDSFGVPKIQLDNIEYNEVFSFVESIKNEYFKLQDDYSFSIIRSFLHIIITKLYRIKFKNENKIDEKKYLSQFLELKELVERDCFKTKKVKDYADNMLLSTKTLNNIVRNVLNKSAKTFIDETVIMQIKRLLINTDFSIKEIAYTSGFEEPTNLYKYFKKHAKTTPEIFRKNYK